MTKILVADDIDENRYLLTAVFKGGGYDVVSAANGAEALELAQQVLPDLIVTDILMPVMDGFELCRRLKQDEVLSGIPLIFYTATYTDPKDEQFALGLGADRFVVKPQKPAILARLVHEVLEEARQKRATWPSKPLDEELSLSKQQIEVLYRKLERKVAQLQDEVADRKRIQAKLEESQTRLLEAHRLAHIGIWDWDCDAGTVVWSDELYRIAGIDPLGPAPRYAEQAKLYTEESWRRLSAAVDEALRSAAPYQLEMEMVRSDGTRRWVNALGSAQRGEDGRVISLHGMVQDITERKRSEESHRKLEEQLRMSQKMEAIGSLAGGVAHDFNNLLSVILSFVDFARDELDDDDPLMGDLTEVKKAGERAAGLTRQLLAFSRRQVLDPRPLVLNEVVTNLERMLRRLIGEDIDVRHVLAPDLAMIRADPGQIDQVIMNLVVNARDAMPQGGKLTIETTNVLLDDNYTGMHVAVTPGQYVLLAISDTGCGMDVETQERLFEPFFTTKETGKGTGLGLSTVYGIVKQSGGSIAVYSEVDKGTTFKLYFPKLIETIVPVSARLGSERTAVGSETVLVVEDEDAVRKAVVRILSAAGYQVLEAASASVAMTLFEQHQGEIHLLLTDVVMPLLSGRNLAEQLVEARPGLRVLFMSGFTDGAIVHHGILAASARFIAKPFSRAELTHKVRDVLDRVELTPTCTPIQSTE